MRYATTPFFVPIFCDWYVIHRPAVFSVFVLPGPVFQSVVKSWAARVCTACGGGSSNSHPAGNGGRPTGSFWGQGAGAASACFDTFARRVACACASEARLMSVALPVLTAQSRFFIP